MKKQLWIFAVVCLFAMFLCSVGVAEGTEATISKNIWVSKVNGTERSSSLPLRSAQTFSRNTVYGSVEELPENKIKMDDGTTACSIYFWKDGDDCYWWSDADTIYLPADARYMFYRCSSLTVLDVSGFNTNNVTNMLHMFSGCSSLTSLDVSRFNTSNVTNMGSMFNGCSNLAVLDVSHFDTGNVTSMDGMFAYCSGLTSLDVTGFSTSNVTNMISMFNYCSSLTSLDLSGWNTTNVTDMHWMFSNCSGLTSLDVAMFDTSNVTNMNGMFSGCTSLTSLDVSAWNISNVTRMQNMFAYCHGLTSLNISEWNASNVTDMDSMFSVCDGLTSLDLSGWNTVNLTRVGSMFRDCYNLTFVDLSGFDTRKATDAYSLDHMFDGCGRLKKVILGTNKYKMLLPVPPSSQDGVQYTRKWIREDGLYGPFTPSELKSNYNSETMSGTWIWEPVPTEYTLRFSSASYPGAVGEMAQVTTSAKADYQLAANQYGLFGFSFDHWDDGDGHTYADQAVIPANTYKAGDVITLNLVMTKRDTSVNMQNGSFDVSIKGNEKALFQPIPASTTYQVYEQTPKGWNLIYQAGNAGTIGSLMQPEAIFLNRYDPLRVTIRLAGTKLLDGIPAEEGSFTFLLCENDELMDIATVQDGGLIEFQPITYDRAGVHHYYISEAVGSDVGINYDTHVEAVTVNVTVDDDGGLDVIVDMDADEILFENVSKPGKIILRKLGVNERDSSMDGIFYYELQFFTANGQPYELFGSTITYEERDDNGVNYPDLQPVEKQKYILTVKYIRENLDGTVQSEEVNTYEYYAGDIFTLNDLNDSAYRFHAAEGLSVLQVGSAWNGVMPRSDSEVSLRYEPVKTATIGSWINSMANHSAPFRSATTFTRDTDHASAADLPSNARKIDDGRTLCSIYVWNDGTDYYWWSDAEIVYMKSPGMFYGCGNLTSIDIDGWDASRLTSMASMFDQCYRLTSLNGIANFDISNVTSLYCAFRDCRGLTSLDISQWDTSNVTNMVATFAWCTGLTSLDVSGWNTSKVTQMGGIVNQTAGGTFSWCTKLTDIDVTHWDVSQVTTMECMFDNCQNIISLDVSNWDTSNVTDMHSMFADCSDLTSLDVSHWDTSNVTDMSYMFDGCESIPILDVSGWDTSKVTGFRSFVSGCKSLTSLDVSHFDTSHALWMCYAFQDCSKLTVLDVSGWDTHFITDLSSMFAGCKNLVSLDCSNWDTSRVTKMGSMFYNCNSLTSLDVSGFDTSNVTYMGYMFKDCSGLTSLDVSGWNTKRVSNMGFMFSSCTQLATVYVGPDWKVASSHDRWLDNCPAEFVAQ